jgi:ribose/xylose/arabinose/galactoside ABC-type transport system permease subunit
MQASVISVITLIVVIAVSAMVTYQVLGALEPSTPEENQVFQNLRSKGATAFNLMAVLVIVLVVVLIIGAVVGAFRPAPQTVAPTATY